MNHIKDIETMRFTRELQTFDRKSARIDAKALAIPIVAFANADGGDIAIGIEDKGDVTGIDGYEANVNELLRVPFDYCVPTVNVDTELMDCIDVKGNPNHILIMHVLQSSQLHANQADEVYYRIGDKSKKMNFEQRTRLMYAKGARFFEDTPVRDATVDDIDLNFVQSYIEKIGYGRSPLEYLRGNKDFIVSRDGKEEISGAAILLFGKNPQRFFPRARVRFIRYEGTEAKVGTEMNVIKDVTFDGKILDMAQKSTEFVKTQISERTFLGNLGRFVTIPELPEFCWTELIINGIGHRDYSILGTDIQIKMFDDHFVVESPGMLPGIVRTTNIREIHFSRNPKIFEFLHEYEYVKEFGEGVDRMYREMSEAGLPEPEYRTVEFMVFATLKNHKWVENHALKDQKGQAGAKSGSSRGQDKDQDGDKKNNGSGLGLDPMASLIEYCSVPRSRKEMQEFVGMASRTHFKENYLIPLLREGKIKMTVPDKPTSKNQRYIKV
ncbi:MAG: putative DNA binding domain-containing protein [Lachnospiraceae bacterium]|nr:putative DNA binding domain-containing protein [Lachnospiraceae bacterium]